MIGHADRRPSRIGNDLLGLLRAKEVAAVLIATGIDPSSIEVESRGDRQPLIPEDPASPSNRRVEIELYCD